MAKKRIGIALGGGGSRGVAHIGVLEVLVQHGIKPEIVVGTSAGSVIGALYCDNQDIERLKRLILPLKRSDVIDLSFVNPLEMFRTPVSPVSLEKLKKMLIANFRTLRIEEFSLRYAAVATDMKTHQPYVFDRGNVIDAIIASTALPPIFSPLRLGDHLLVDGGITNPVPVSIVRNYKPDLMIAVNINSPYPQRENYGIFDLTVRALMTSYYSLAVEQSRQADFTIHPDLMQYNIFSDNASQEIYELGKAEALKVVPAILKALH